MHVFANVFCLNLEVHGFVKHEAWVLYDGVHPKLVEQMVVLKLQLSFLLELKLNVISFRTGRIFLENG